MKHWLGVGMKRGRQVERAEAAGIIQGLLDIIEETRPCSVDALERALAYVADLEGET
jgi:hypothetical protein